MISTRNVLSLGAALALSAACAPTTPPDAGPGEDPTLGCDLGTGCPGGEERPGRRSELEGVYDPVGERVILFGGSEAVPQNCGNPTPEYLTETWAFYDRCGTWERVPASGPSPRSRHMMAYDLGNHRALVFGGRFRQGAEGNYTNFNDVWALDLQSETWSEVPATNPPTARVNAAFQVEPEGRFALLFGGNISLSGLNYNAQNDLWSLDLETNAWSQLSPAGTPPEARLFVSSLYDKERDRFVIFGGAKNDAFFVADYFNDVWSYDVGENRWTQLHNGNGAAPAGRFWAGWDYDEENDRYVLFGGHDDTDLGNTNDVWSFDPASGAWEQLEGGDTWNRPSNGFCDFPEDFTNVDMLSPERRNAHVFVYSSLEGCPSLISTMGKTDCGAADDVHRFRAATNDWEEVVPANEGEVCLRADRGFDCFSMCD